ncbi:2-dehydropantoate 2-reductase [Corynebacterium sp. TA-R-1]|uniref:2-dehydropantoate 2-reductase n=1 Tax=Corynebacterium stercoris TaxID=2943490 RepID=A0ABT1G3G7_9CORY|nr:2-dehydropantoate 2-reductase [Corynebacterium stercoris]MCP1388327.1 2-dehydropantoate 2-reductase [Corynebacterium stercoris]
MKIAVIGAGAMGQLFGARFIAAGEDVVFFDVMDQTIDALNNDGIELIIDGESTHVEAKAAKSADYTEPVDFVLFFTKGFHTPGAIAGAKHLFHENTIALTLQNGIGNGELLLETFGEDNTLAGVTDYSADRAGANAITSSSYGSIAMGDLVADGVNSDAAVQIHELLTRAGFNAELFDNVNIPIWEKLILNTVLNTIGGATGLTLAETNESEPGHRLFEAVLAEALAVAEARQVPVRADVIREHIDTVFAKAGSHKTSMTQDVEAGRRTEIDAIGGAVAKAGLEAGVPTPVLSTLADVVRARTLPRG